MKKLFGSKKKEEPKQPAPSLHETSAKVLTIIIVNIAILDGWKNKGSISQSWWMQLRTC